MWGAIHSYEALKAAGKTGNNFIVMGPWRHSQINRTGSELGPFKWNGDTALQYREDMIIPFFNQYLKDGPAVTLPAATIYNTGENHWDRFSEWPLACDKGCPSPLTPLYLGADGGLGFDGQAAGGDSYVSDPAKPVPMLPRPITMSGDEWKTWLVHDQRFVDGRTDVLSYSTGVLDKPLHIKGAPKVDLRAATSGRDSDYVVKLIDVYPAENSADPTMAGYQLGIGIEIFRGRYVGGFDKPQPLEPGKVYDFKWELPNVDHVFLPGHKIMVQVQSSLFPLYDRNPQSWVPSIMEAKPGDYVKATETIHWGGDSASAVWLPVAHD
jgi:putative CocE/NonD family hydrolase